MQSPAAVASGGLQDEDEEQAGSRCDEDTESYSDEDQDEGGSEYEGEQEGWDEDESDDGTGADS